jgi:Cu(I)/Ag(I) efflux system protein CusF
MKTMKTTPSFLLALATALSLAVAPAMAQPDPALAEGEIRKVDKEAQKVTIRHGEIKSLDMPPMTMVFQVADPALLDKVKAGDKVRFSAEKSGGSYRVTGMELAR